MSIFRVSQLSDLFCSCLFLLALQPNNVLVPFVSDEHCRNGWNSFYKCVWSFKSLWQILDWMFSNKKALKVGLFFFFLIIIIYYSSLISLTYCVSFYIRIVFGLASDTLFQPFIICLGGCTLQDNVLIWIYKNILFKKMLREMSFLCADLNLYQKHFYEPRITMKTLQSLGLFPINQW